MKGVRANYSARYKMIILKKEKKNLRSRHSLFLPAYSNN